MRAHITERMQRLSGDACPNGMCQGTACFVAGTLVAMTSLAHAQPIDEIQVGDRVEVTAESESLCSHDARESQVRVSFVFAAEEVEWDTIYLTRLMPRAEAESLGYELGGIASPAATSTASMDAIWAQPAEPNSAPSIQGCVVDATNVRSSGDMIHLRLSDATELHGTATHRFWSVTRSEWLAARVLRVGETLRTPSGVVRVVEARLEAVLTPVFNIEVEGAHEFFVGEGEVLAHNGRDACVRRPRLPSAGTWSGTPGDSDFIPNNTAVLPPIDGSDWDPRAVNVPTGTRIPFRNGDSVFDQFAWDEFEVAGLNGGRGGDRSRMISGLAKRYGMRIDEATDYLQSRFLALHHAGGNRIQLIPGGIHGWTGDVALGVPHRGAASAMRIGP